MSDLPTFFDQAKQYLALGGIIVSFAAGISAHFKEEKDETAKISYKELAPAVEKNSENIINLHKDLASLQGYIAGQEAFRKGLMIDQEELISLTSKAKGSVSVKTESKKGDPVVVKIEPVKNEEVPKPPPVSAQPKPYKAPDMAILQMER